ncbi:alpha/beta fold hydrolase [Tsukamurella sp. 1534]|uniref:alpha/beta fold hydrolase n=1 Tax=Tsukamurella sp. 1534 TaxID=1151061 RepID=UPI00030B7645|nr:alpha/beta hydrolase [Tsukamurella sp. 1534]
MTITPHTLRTERHTTAYLAAGPEDGPLLVFCHGWPELSHSWRHQLTALGALGFRCVAPDMRGYGNSTVYADKAAYRREEAVRDMLELLAGLGRGSAVWIGHDWGSPVVWNIATHHPEVVDAVASLNVPHFPSSGPSTVELIDRDVYPADEFPYGQWDYQVHYLKAFDEVTAYFESDVAGLIAALFRSGAPSHLDGPAPTALISRNGGWFGGGPVPTMAPDPAVLTAEDHAIYTAAFQRNGMAGPNSWYVNGVADAEYADRELDGGRIGVPALFLHGRYDATLETVRSRLAEPMRAACADLTEVVVESGHWMAEERPADVNAALVRWLATRVPDRWPGPAEARAAG